MRCYKNGVHCGSHEVYGYGILEDMVIMFDLYAVCGKNVNAVTISSVILSLLVIYVGLYLFKCPVAYGGHKIRRIP